jgi:hypothetical protein
LVLIHDQLLHLYYDEDNRIYYYANTEEWLVLGSQASDIVPLWKSNTNGGSYATNDIINYNGSLYKNLTNTNSNTPPNADTTNWQNSAVDNIQMKTIQDMSGDQHVDDLFGISDNFSIVFGTNTYYFVRSTSSSVRVDMIMRDGNSNSIKKYSNLSTVWNKIGVMDTNNGSATDTVDIWVCVAGSRFYKFEMASFYGSELIAVKMTKWQ